MNVEKDQPRVIKKEMGLTHKEFYDELPNLLDGAPCQYREEAVSFQFNEKNIEIVLGPEGFRQLGQSLRLPVTSVTIRLFDFTAEEVDDFINYFNLKYMKGGG